MHTFLGLSAKVVVVVLCDCSDGLVDSEALLTGAAASLACRSVWRCLLDIQQSPLLALTDAVSISLVLLQVSYKK